MKLGRRMLDRSLAPASIALALAASACASMRPATDDDLETVGRIETPAVQAPPVATSPVVRPSPPTAPAAADSVALRQLSRRTVTTSGGLSVYERIGVTGANKPQGPEGRMRRSIPDDLPPFIFRDADGLELYVADETPDGWLAFYRTPLGEWAGEMYRNAAFHAILFSLDGQVQWSLDLNRFLSRPDHLEIQDVRYADGELYFNEACQTYARDAGGRCSALVRVDPARPAVDWRTPPLVSNDLFILHGPYVIAGYGFTAEPDYVRVIDRQTGRVLHRTGVDSAPEYLEVKDGRLHVLTYNNQHYVFEIVEINR